MKIAHVPWLICLVLVGALAFYFWKEGRATEELLSIKNKELMTANLVIGRAHTELTSQKKAHATAMANLENLWKDEINERKGLVTAYGELEAKYTASVRKGKTLNRIIAKYKRDGPVTIEVPDGELYAKASDGKMTPVKALEYTYEDFRILIKGEYLTSTLKYELNQRFKAQFVAAKLPTGASNHYARIYEVDDKGNELDEMELVSFEVLKADDLPNVFRWFNPKLDLMVGGGANSKLQGTWMADIGVSVMSYGKTPDDLLWRFARLSAGLTRHGFALNVSPAQLNLGKFLPLISNTWLLPYVGYDFGAQAGHGGLGIGLVF